MRGCSQRFDHNVWQGSWRKRSWCHVTLRDLLEETISATRTGDYQIAPDPSQTNTGRPRLRLVHMIELLHVTACGLDITALDRFLKCAPSSFPPSPSSFPLYPNKSLSGKTAQRWRVRIKLSPLSSTTVYKLQEDTSARPWLFKMFEISHDKVEESTFSTGTRTQTLLRNRGDEATTRAKQSSSPSPRWRPTAGHLVARFQLHHACVIHVGSFEKKKATRHLKQLSLRR